MKKILIVEDVEFNTDLLIQLLEDDYELVTAEDGAAGVEKALGERPDLILMDISLPVMDGYEATRRIRESGKLEGVIIIGLSGHAMSGDAQRAIDAGVDDYLTKPLDDELLFEKLEHYLDDA